MSVLFTVLFETSTIHVLQIRGRTAFVARNLGQAAGYSDGGQGFIDLIVREWAASFEEDDDIAQITGADLDVLKREVPLPDDTNMELVLFASGIDLALTRSRARNARSLLGFLHSAVLSQVHSLYGAIDPDDGNQGGAPAAPQAPLAEEAPSPCPQARPTLRVTSVERVVDMIQQDLVGHFADIDSEGRSVEITVERVSEREPGDQREFEALVQLAEDLREEQMITDQEWRDLRVEAVEFFLGRPLRTQLTFGASNLPFAA